MPKGDGWAVKRYICPKCLRKGLYKSSWRMYTNRMECMYKGCQYAAFSNDKKIVAVNPELNVS